MTGPGDESAAETCNEDGEWVSWRIDGRAGAKLRLGPVFLGEISYPHDFGFGGRWKALNHEHLGFFRNEAEASKDRIGDRQAAWPDAARVDQIPADPPEGVVTAGRPSRGRSRIRSRAPATRAP